MEYRLIRSARKTLAVEISREGEVIVRAPLKMPKHYIENFICERRARIEQAIERTRARKPMYHPNAPEAEALRKRAEEIIPLRVEHYAKLMGVEPKSVRITGAQKRFGSCSSQRTLCFSLNLMQYPSEAVDYVVVHELAHLTELNHSKNFWTIVEKYMPDYKKRRAMLKE